jgi:hypothetical protein
MENQKKGEKNGKGKSPDEYKDTSTNQRFPFRSGKKHQKNHIYKQKMNRIYHEESRYSTICNQRNIQQNAQKLA